MFGNKKISFENGDLRTKLLSGETTSVDFLDLISENDKKENHLVGCFQNVKLLADQEIGDFLSESSPEYYFKILSLTYFHIGQKLSLDNDAFSAIKNFKFSLGAAIKRDENTSLSQDWILYIKGTIAYLESDLIVLEKCFNEVKEMNKDVLERLLNGLKKRGKPDYQEDYTKAYI